MENFLEKSVVPEVMGAFCLIAENQKELKTVAVDAKKQILN